MLLPLILQLCLISITLSGTTASNATVGRAIWLPTYNLLGQGLDETGASVFASVLQKCLRKYDGYTSNRQFAYYSNTKSLYTSLTTTAGLSASLQSDFSLRFTLDSASKAISGGNHTVSGNSLLISAATGKIMLDKNCLNSADFDSNFLRDLNNLPPNISAPWETNAWYPYKSFIRKYGSHVVSSVTLGSMINQMAFADTSHSYSERDFQVASCVKLFGPTEAGMVNTSLCANVSQEEISKSTTMKKSETLTVTGGTPETRNKLIQMQTLTGEVIEKFLNEANATQSPISYTFSALWEVIQGHFIGSSDNFIKGINLEYYYLGLMNYGCPFITQGGQNLQVFNFTSGSTPDAPQYECTLAPKGCHSDDDCHYRPIWCYCGGTGPSCVQYQDQTLDTGNSKTTASINKGKDWGWQGCDWKVAGFTCRCKHESHQRFTVWSADNKAPALSAHQELMKIRSKSKLENVKEEL